MGARRSRKIFSGESFYSIYEVYNAIVESIPPATVPPINPPSVPKIRTLCASVIASTDMLFLIAHRTPGSTTREWSLVHVVLRETISFHPNALQDGKFLVELFICHLGIHFTMQ